jgi:enamine deaminase RidA (YjgF/YER057c/UK114 family)
MRLIISTGKGPNAIGPYSQAVRGGQFIFVSGQISLDPATQKIIRRSSPGADSGRRGASAEGQAR